MEDWDSKHTNKRWRGKKLNWISPLHSVFSYIFSLLRRHFFKNLFSHNECTCIHVTLICNSLNIIFTLFWYIYSYFINLKLTNYKLKIENYMSNTHTQTQHLKGVANIGKKPPKQCCHILFWYLYFSTGIRRIVLFTINLK